MRLTRNSPEATMPWLRLAAAVLHQYDEDFQDGQPLYRNSAPLPLRECHSSVLRSLLTFDFLIDHKRAQQFHIDAEEAGEDFTTACLGALERGYGTTEYAPFPQKKSF